MAITDVISDLSTSIKAISGIRDAPTEPPDSINVFPFVVIYPISGTHRLQPGTGGGIRLELMDIVVELHSARKDLPRGFTNAIGYHESIPNAILADTTLGGNVDTLGDITYNFASMNYGGIDTIGYRFIIKDIKTRNNIS